MISIKELNHHFDSKVVLSDINLTVKKAEIIGVIGKSGCGKSTLLRCIQGLETPSSGLIQLNGQCSMIFQQFNLFPHFTVLQNIIYPLTRVLKFTHELATAKAMALLEQVQLADKANVYPRTLSGGQKQRIAIVRALALNPDILLLDEPTSALDPTMVQEVFNVIQQVAKMGMTFMLVSHEMRFIQQITHRVIELDDGKIICDLPTEKFFKDLNHA